MNLAKPKAAAKRELLIQKPISLRFVSKINSMLKNSNYQK